jgi:hypothetical protein
MMNGVVRYTRPCFSHLKFEQGVITMRSTLNTLATLLFLGTGSMASAQEPAQVATLNEAEGTVMVDQGKGFVTFRGDTVLKEGDRVVTLGGSSAKITFADGCKAQLKANNMMTITRTPGCKADIADIVPVQETVASTGPAAPFAHNLFVPALAGITAVGAVADNNDNDDTPISAE